MISMNKEMTFPEKIVTFPVYQDVVASDNNNIAGYINAIADNNFAGAGTSLATMNHFANKVITTRDWQLMYDTVMAAKKVVDDFAPEGETPGENLTEYFLSGSKPSTIKENDLWFDTSLSSSACYAIGPGRVLPTSIDVGATERITIAVLISEEERGGCTDIVYVKSVKNLTTGKTVKASSVCQIQPHFSPGYYYTIGLIDFYLCPIKAGNYRITFECGQVGAKKTLDLDFEFVSSGYRKIYYIGFDDTNYIWARGVRLNGTYTTLKRKNGEDDDLVGSIVKGRDLIVMQEETRGWPVVVRQLVSGTPTFENVTSQLVDGGDRYAVDVLCYQFTVNKNCSVELVGSDDERRTDTTSDEYIGFYSSDKVLLIDLDYAADEGDESNA